VLHLLQNELNFTVELKRRFDGEWGRVVVDENGGEQWVGMVQSLMEGDGDIILASLTMTPQRYHKGLKWE